MQSLGPLFVSVIGDDTHFNWSVISQIMCSNHIVIVYYQRINNSHGPQNPCLNQQKINKQKLPTKLNFKHFIISISHNTTDDKSDDFDARMPTLMCFPIQLVFFANRLVFSEKNNDHASHERLAVYLVVPLVTQFHWYSENNEWTSLGAPWSGHAL